MKRKAAIMILTPVLLFIPFSCAEKKVAKMTFCGAKYEVKLMTLDPGHFHAALVQKKMYEEISPIVYVYAPKGADVEDHQNRIKGFNHRAENPTSWTQRVYTGDDFFEKMLQEQPGNVVVISGNNKKKAEYIKACIEAGLNVLADKPMCIDAKGFQLLKDAFAMADKKGVLLYDVMTERFSITSILQKKLIHNSDVFGQLQKGTVDEPAVVRESVHHFSKYVAGNPIKRPAWYFDTAQQGEGIVDVTTHLIDLVMWTTFPTEAIDFQRDIEIKKAKRWPTRITREQFSTVTGLGDFPDFLKEKLDPEGVLDCFANGEIVFSIKGVNSKVSVIWNFEAPEGTKDTHYSIARGSKANILILQGKEQNYKPELYVEPAADVNKDDLAIAIKTAIGDLELKEKGRRWHIVVPDEIRIGHEEHFREVTKMYLQFLADGKMPDWEIANMITKYNITTAALELACK